MTRPLLLDLFCGAGGAAMGYWRAGFDIIGVDIDPQPNYPFPFIQGDALQPPVHLERFDAIHASPPCQGESSLRAIHPTIEYERLLTPVLDRFADLQIPWVVENVDNATAPARLFKIRVCGSSFGLRVRRHRWFWSNVLLFGLPCDHARQTDLVGVYGSSDGAHEPGFMHLGRKRGPRQATTIECREVMGMPWVEKRRGLTEAIPPAYTEHIGSQLLAALEQA